MYLITDQMKINWLFLNSLFAWFMVTLTSLDISLILSNTKHWALKLQEAKQHVYTPNANMADHSVVARDKSWKWG